MRDGLPYLSASAGTNLACPTIRTTNDMPIVEPRSLAALGLVTFQINPHYAEVDPASAAYAASRDQRIGEFLQENDVPVVALREGAWLDVRPNSILVGGPTGGRLFQRGVLPRELPRGSDLTASLERRAVYDSPANKHVRVRTDVTSASNSLPGLAVGSPPPIAAVGAVIATADAALAKGPSAQKPGRLCGGRAVSRSPSGLGTRGLGLDAAPGGPPGPLGGLQRGWFDAE